MNVPLWAWSGVLAVIVAMLAVDRRAREIGLRQAAAWSALWVVLGLAFGLVVWAGWGAQRAGEYFAGYLIEKSLAVDNVFIFALVISAFAVPRAYQHRVLFLGVVAARGSGHDPRRGVAGGRRGRARDQRDRQPPGEQDPAVHNR